MPGWSEGWQVGGHSGSGWGAGLFGVGGFRGHGLLWWGLFLAVGRCSLAFSAGVGWHAFCGPGAWAGFFWCDWGTCKGEAFWWLGQLTGGRCLNSFRGVGGSPVFNKLFYLQWGVRLRRRCRLEALWVWLAEATFLGQPPILSWPHWLSMAVAQHQHWEHPPLVRE